MLTYKFQKSVLVYLPKYHHFSWNELDLSSYWCLLFGCSFNIAPCIMALPVGWWCSHAWVFKVGNTHIFMYHLKSLSMASLWYDVHSGQHVMIGRRRRRRTLKCDTVHPDAVWFQNKNMCFFRVLLSKYSSQPITGRLEPSLHYNFRVLPYFYFEIIRPLGAQHVPITFTMDYIRYYCCLLSVVCFRICCNFRGTFLNTVFEYWKLMVWGPMAPTS